MGTERALDLAGLDAEAADLDLVVRAPEELDRPVGGQPPEVAGAVCPRGGAAAYVQLDEPLRGQLRPEEVAVGEAGPREVQLSRHADRHRPAPRVEQVDAGVGDRAADGRDPRPEIGVAVQRVRGHHVRFGRAVVVVEPLPARAEPAADRVGDAQLVARGDHLLEARDQAAGPQGRLGQVVERHGGEEEALDPRPVEELDERVGVAAGGLVDEDQRAPGAPGGEGLLERDVEAERRELERPRGLRVLRLPLDEVDQRPVGHGDALRLAGRARGVEDVGEVMRLQLRRGAPRRRARFGFVGQDDLHARGGEEVPVPLLGDEDARLRALQHVAEALGRVRGVERDVGAAGLERGQHGRQRGDRSVEAERDARAGADAERGQPIGEGLRLLVELAVGPGLAAVLERHAVGRLARLAGEELGQRPPRVVCTLRPVEVGDEALLVRGQERDLGEAQLGPGDDGFQQPPEVGGHALDPVVVEQVRAVFEDAGERALPRLHEQGEVELGGGALEGGKVDAEAGQPDVASALALDHEHHLEERVVPEGAGDAEPGDQLLEGDVLVRIGLERGLPDAGHDLGEGGIARQVDAERQRVEEVADHALGLAAVAIGGRRPDHHVFLAADPAEVGREGAQQRHEERGARPRGQLLEPLAGRGREHEGPRLPPEARPLGARAVAGEVDRAGSALQRSPPVREALLEAAALQPPPLPAGPVGVADRRVRQRRLRAAREGGVRDAKLAQQYADRPRVDDDVVLVDDEDVLVRTQAEQARPEEGPGREREGGGDLLGDAPVEEGRLDVLDRQHRGRGGRRSYPLDRGPPGAVVERRAQRLVTLDQERDGPGERARVERAAEPEHERHVVGRVPAAQRIDEPQAFLAGGERQVAGQVGARDRLGGRARRRDRLGQPRDRLALEDHPDRQLDAEGLADPGDDLGRAQRVSPQLEEVGGHPGRRPAEHLGPDAGEDLFLRRARRDVDSPLRLGGPGGQRGVVDLPVRREREVVDDEDPARDHRRGQLRREVAREHVGRRRLGTRPGRGEGQEL